MEKSQTTDREVSGLVLRAVLSYVERAAGVAALQEVAERSGIGDPASVMRDTGLWYSIAETLHVADEAARVCGETSIGRRTGEEQILGLCDDGFREFVVALGSVPAAMEEVLQSAQRMSSGRRFTITEEGEHQLLIESRTTAGRGHPRFFCEYVQGVLVTIPPIFGLVARVVERQCQGRGDDRCQYHLSWGPDPRVVPSDLDLAASEALVEARLSSLEDAQAMAADLLRYHDIEGVLEQICDLATTTLEAPRFLVAVRVGTTDRLRVHQRGFADDAVARARAEQLASGDEPNEGDGILVAKVGARGGAQGVLAVLSIAEATYSPWEVRTLEAYARHAEAALDIVTTLDRAQRDRDTARALLELASALASVGTTDEIAARLTDVTLKTTHCTASQYWTWSPDDQALRLSAFADVEGRPLPGPERVGSDFPGAVDVARSGEPFLIRSCDADEPFRGVFEQLAVEIAAVVPVIAHGTPLGLLTAAFPSEIPEDDVPQLMATLTGLADHGAIALENAQLVEDIRYQSLHDPLTGLANRALVEHHADLCLAAARRSGASTALLFLDLDGFKRINDTFGHSAGDDLIRKVGERLQATVRASEVLARIGGDEFVVLMPEAGLDAALELAERMVTTLRSPFVVHGETIRMTASIGVARALDGGDTYDALLGRADDAMYRAKADAGDRIAAHESPSSPTPG